MSDALMHPRSVLLGAQAAAGVLPVCDHYCGVEARMLKSLRLQSDMSREFGACVFDVTLDCEDGAPVGGEQAHAEMLVDIARSAFADWRGAVSAGREAIKPRIAVRVHPVDHPAFERDVELIAGGLGADLCHLMIPKVESLQDVEVAVTAVDRVCSNLPPVTLPLHVLIESPGAVHRAFDIASHPRVQSLSFGLMDFVSAHAGAIPAKAMTVGAAGANVLDQFRHPLVVRAKLDVSEACHAWAKVPSHCVVTEFQDMNLMKLAAQRAAQELGYTRMWSIHPSQIRPILEAFAPSEEDIELAARIIRSAQTADWAPISVDGQLHDRASYRYFWQLLERAHCTGRKLPVSAQCWFQIARAA
ncbi:MAG: hypothetical protein RJA34_1349 [Pseudomonadota bacterium]|jgi:citrate lyase subunit beta/citryl-CoA lyase